MAQHARPKHSGQIELLPRPVHGFVERAKIMPSSASTLVKSSGLSSVTLRAGNSFIRRILRNLEASYKLYFRTMANDKPAQLRRLCYPAPLRAKKRNFAPVQKQLMVKRHGCAFTASELRRRRRVTLLGQRLQRKTRGSRDRGASWCSTSGKSRRAARLPGSLLARTWSLPLLIVMGLLFGNIVRGQQQQPPQSQINVDVKVVNVLATVRDKHGMIVSNLGKDDFVLTEDGKPQTITYFSRETDVPLTMGLLVDTSGSQQRMLDDERSASHSFLDECFARTKTRPS